MVNNNNINQYNNKIIDWGTFSNWINNTNDIRFDVKECIKDICASVNNDTLNFKNIINKNALGIFTEREISILCKAIDTIDTSQRYVELAHCWSIGTNIRQNVLNVNKSYLGMKGQDSTNFFKKTLINFITNNSQLRDSDVSCIESLIKTMDFHTTFAIPDESQKQEFVNLIFQEWRDGKPAFINTGWKGHCVCVLLFNKFLVKANRGQKREKNAVEVYEIDLENVSDEAMKNAIKKLRFDALKYNQYNAYFLKTRTALEGTQPVILTNGGLHDDLPLIERPDLHINMKSQKSGNCTIASKKAALLGALSLNELLNKDEECYVQARNIYKSYTSFSRLYSLNKVYQDALENPDRIDMSILDQGKIKLNNKFCSNNLTEEQMNNFSNSIEIFNKIDAINEKPSLNSENINQNLVQNNFEKYLYSRDLSYIFYNLKQKNIIFDFFKNNSVDVFKLWVQGNFFLDEFQKKAIISMVLAAEGKGDIEALIADCFQ